MSSSYIVERIRQHTLAMRPADDAFYLGCSIFDVDLMLWNYCVIVDNEQDNRFRISAYWLQPSWFFPIKHCIKILKVLKYLWGCLCFCHKVFERIVPSSWSEKSVRVQVTAVQQVPSLVKDLLLF